MMYKSFTEYVRLRENNPQVVSQDELRQLFPNGKSLLFVKNTPVAIVPFAQLASITTPQQRAAVMQLIGDVDKTKYQDSYLSKGFVVFQWDSKNNRPDVYVAPSIESKYMKFTGEMPANPAKVPSLVCLSHFGIDPKKVPFFIKKVPTKMISAADVGLEGRTIQTSWGTQDVAPGGYLVQEDNGHVYTVAPDQRGLPIGYVPFQ